METRLLDTSLRVKVFQQSYFLCFTKKGGDLGLTVGKFRDEGIIGRRMGERAGDWTFSSQLLGIRPLFQALNVSRMLMPAQG